MGCLLKKDVSGKCRKIEEEKMKENLGENGSKKNRIQGSNM
jgi:hypothetical protein